MNLTYEEKQDIAEAIKVIFKGALPATPNQITEEVADMVTKIINGITVCSKRIEKTLKTTQQILYMGYPIQILIGKVGKEVLGAFLENWFTQLSKNFATRACAVTAAAKWRSPVTLALMGL